MVFVLLKTIGKTISSAQEKLGWEGYLFGGRNRQDNVHSLGHKIWGFAAQKGRKRTVSSSNWSNSRHLSASKQCKRQLSLLSMCSKSKTYRLWGVADETFSIQSDLRVESFLLSMSKTRIVPSSDSVEFRHAAALKQYGVYLFLLSINSKQRINHLGGSGGIVFGAQEDVESRPFRLGSGGRAGLRGKGAKGWAVPSQVIGENKPVLSRILGQPEQKIEQSLLKSDYSIATYRRKIFVSERKSHTWYTLSMILSNGPKPPTFWIRTQSRYPIHSLVRFVVPI